MPAKARKLTVSSYDTHSKLLLAGVWLDRAGFQPGDKVTITNPEPGRLIIEVLPPIDATEEQQKEPPALTTLQVAEPEPKFYRSLLFPAA